MVGSLAQRKCSLQSKSTHEKASLLRVHRECIRAVCLVLKELRFDAVDCRVESSTSTSSAVNRSTV